MATDENTVAELAAEDTVSSRMPSTYEYANFGPVKPLKDQS